MNPQAIDKTKLDRFRNNDAAHWHQAGSTNNSRYTNDCGGCRDKKAAASKHENSPPSLPNGRIPLRVFHLAEEGRLARASALLWMQYHYIIAPDFRFQCCYLEE